VDTIPSGEVVTEGALLGDPTEPEIQIAIEDVGGIVSTAVISTRDTIQPMASVLLSSDPFSTDGNIGNVTPILASSNVDTTLVTALGGGIIITQ
jgi:hypothetical protein